MAETERFNPKSRKNEEIHQESVRQQLDIINQK